MSYCGIREFPADYSLNNVGITQSLIKTYLSCPVKFLFATHRYYNPFTSGRGTGFGSIAHDVLEKCYAGAPLIPTDFQVARWIQEYIASHMDELRGKDTDQLALDVAVLEVLIPAYLHNYRKDFTKYKIAMVERTLETEWQGVKLRCKVDLVIESEKKLYVMDHKTSGRIVEDTLCKVLTFDFQHLMYSLIVKQVTGKPIAGSYHNVIRNPDLKCDGDLIAYKDKLTNDISRRPDHYFKRFIINYDHQDIETFSAELFTILSTIGCSLEDGEQGLYKNVCSCTNAWGACEFLEACSSGSLALYKQKDHLFEELDDGKDKQGKAGKPIPSGTKRLRKK